MTPQPEIQSPTVVLFATDLIFQTRIRSTAESLGIALQAVRDPKSVLEHLATPSVSTLIVDLDRGEDAIHVIEHARHDRPSLGIIAYGSHIEVALFERAKAAGADEVLPRSRFTQELPAILQATISRLG